MAVDTTPERSFSDLLSSSRATEATTGCTCGASSVPRWLVVIMIRERAHDRARRIGEEGGDAGQRLLLLGIEDVQDGADQQRVRGLLPVVAPLRARLPDRPGCRRCSGRRAPRPRPCAPRAAGCSGPTADRSDRTAGSARTCERQPAVSCQFSPLMSWTTAEPVQVSSVGTTRPTPLPERVGAKAMTCSGPSWRR